VLWTFLATAVIGIATGLRFRVPLLALSALLMSVAAGGAAAHLGWTVSGAMTAILSVLAIQQGSYLIGLFVACHLLPPRVASIKSPAKER
jgi:hypothetical protein